MDKSDDDQTDVGGMKDEEIHQEKVGPSDDGVRLRGVAIILFIGSESGSGMARRLKI